MKRERPHRPPRTVGCDTFDAFGVLRAYLRARAPFTESDFEYLQTMFVPRVLHAGECLQRAGSVARYAAFVARGCVRTHVIDSTGTEQTVQFAPETGWVADNVSLTSGTPSQYFIEALDQQRGDQRGSRREVGHLRAERRAQPAREEQCSQ